MGEGPGPGGTGPRPAGAHPLATVLLAAVSGRFPPVDGAVTVVPPYLDGVEAMVSFTGHAVAATSLTADRLRAAGADGFAGATSAPVMAELAGPDGELDVLDVLLAAHGTARIGHPAGQPDGPLPERHDLDDHPRVRYARRHRRDVRVYGDERGLVTLAHGLGGLLELSFEVPEPRRGRGLGRSVVADALALVGTGQPVLAAVAPGNAASLRALLAAGFVPLGSVQLVHPGPGRR